MEIIVDVRETSELLILSLLLINIIISIGTLANYSYFQTYLALAQQNNITGNATAAAANAAAAAPPVADAGDDQTVSEGTIVQLNGSASTDPDRDMLSFAWNRTSGTQVTLSDESSATPTFTAPDVGAAGDTLTFELTVYDADGNNSTDTVNVIVHDVGSINQAPPTEQSAALIDDATQGNLSSATLGELFQGNLSSATLGELFQGNLSSATLEDIISQRANIEGTKVATEAATKAETERVGQQLTAFTNTMIVSVGAITVVIGIPLILNMYLRYRQASEMSKKGINVNLISINQLYRVLVAIAVIFIVILIVAYLNSLIWFSSVNAPSAEEPDPIVTALLDTQKNFLTIIGTAFASLVAFYFGTKATQDKNSEQNRSTTRTTTSSPGSGTAQKTLEVININPINGTVGVELDSPVTATFGSSIRSLTINTNTFSVKDANDNPVQGKITLTDNNTTIIFIPVPPFNRNSRYTVTITKGIMDVSGASLAADTEWHFTTVA